VKFYDFEIFQNGGDEKSEIFFDEKEEEKSLKLCEKNLCRQA
jgi:hypothetical protein